jgi:CMP-N,N'-diacetyllegionaminic acid synthase|tara:strand:- start:473 stop:1159 length:687 start_codon:yes stop_codon:yes gene_type:complete
MYNNKIVICLILARGGSKGIPRKNVKKIGGKPLILHSIDVAKNTKQIDEIYVSTDDKEIKKISQKNGVKIIDRPKKYAEDTSNYLDSVKFSLNLLPDKKMNPIIVLLETTSPIRSKKNVEDCIKLFNEKIDCVSSITEVKISPAYFYKINNDLLEKYDSNFIPKNRQEMEKIFYYNGSIFVTTLNFLKSQKNVVFGGKMKGYLLNEKNSFDIDTPLDFKICDFLLKEK